MRTHGCLTDAIFHHDHGRVQDKGDYYLITTPANPTFHWGNYLLFKSPPTECSYSEWIKIHEQEFGPTPGHIALGWDSEARGNISEFEARGFTLNDGIVLRLAELPTPPAINSNLEIRELSSDLDWQTVVDQQVADGFDGISEASFREFKLLQMALYRKSQNRGLGHWWGAFLDHELVGSTGLFFDRKKRLGRFQQVHTVASHRRQGVCTTLVSTAARQAFTREKINELIIVTDVDSAPEQLYRSVGFQRLGPQFGLCKTFPA